MASGAGFLVEELEMESQNAKVMPSLSLKYPGQGPSVLHEHHFLKVSGSRHLSALQSGKLIRVEGDGTGNKGTWSKLLDADDETCIDKKESNYDRGQEPYELVGSNASHPLDDYKKALFSIIEDYFNTGDVEVAASDLTELGSSHYHPHFIKHLVSMAMSRHSKEKEMASFLLSTLYADGINAAQISQGFFMLLVSADDLAVNALDTVESLALFLARAVVDDILPPAFITKARKMLSENSKGVEVLQTAEKRYLSGPYHAELVERRLGGSAHITVEAEKKISTLLRAYVESGDASEASRCIRQLGVPFLHHEVVKRALALSMEIPTVKPLIQTLLKESADDGLISSRQMAKGFTGVLESLDDLSLDIPSAKNLLHSLILQAISDGWLDTDYLKSLTEEKKTNKNSRCYKKEIVSIIHEYFLADDIPELIRSLEDLKMPKHNPVFLKKLVTLALDRRNREKEMASVLLSVLHIEIFSTEDIINGFVMLLESAEDTTLDILDASNDFAFFLARAVIDDVLTPLNLEEIASRLPPNCSGTETVRSALSLIGARHAGERILRCWGGGTGWAVEDAKDKIQKLLEEYETGGVLNEACQCIRDLAMPFFNHEVVKKALVMAMEKQNDRILELLQVCFGEGLITITQMTKGFSRIRDGLEDLVLDIPNAKDKFGFYVKYAMERGWLTPTFAAADS